MRTQVHTSSVVAEEGENVFAPRLGQCRSSHGAVQQARQLGGVVAAVFRRQDGVAEQLRPLALVATRLCRSQDHVAAVLQFQQLSAAAVLQFRQLEVAAKCWQPRFREVVERFPPRNHETGSSWWRYSSYKAIVIDEIIENISRKLNHTFSTSDFKDFVGMDRVNKIELYMSRGLDEHEATVIGICGMSGIGKTTIAQVLFERIRNKFEASCFIHDVREMSEWKILPLVLKKLYGNLSNTKVSVEDVNGVRSRLLSHKRVLIILDDIDNLKQIEAIVGCGARGLYDQFGQGSRIIVTTKDKSLLKAYEPKIHMVGKLNFDEALILFSRRAFGKDPPLDEYVDLSNQFVDYVGGLPLALTVFGSFLFRRRFDGLASSDEKDIFLDIACFFKGESVKRVERIFESCDYYPDISIRVLLENSLLTIFGGKLWMHHLLQGMGKDIVRKQSQQELGKRSWLWLHEDTIEVLCKNEVIEA
ncbi:TMV resistance protein N-like [Prunus avium]|uniref:TMV resistance protein N-like n=1 Tax=Prunus avium TaxID=42229 RepID=A0A6P5SNH7_PRUAV|nr:TMV resistance protein N-like [Prunus avium]